MGGGGVIIIHQAEVLKTALSDPAFYSGLVGDAKLQADYLLGNPAVAWSYGDRLHALHLLKCGLAT